MKNSGVEWIGEITDGWEVKKLKYLGNYINGYAFKPEDWKSFGKRIIRIQDLTSNNENPNYYNEELDKCYEVKKGDILVSWAATLDAFIWDKETGWLNQHIFKAEPFVEIVNKSFFFWLIKESMKNMNNDNKHGIVMQHVTLGVFNNFEVPLPPKETQQKIAAYLDSKCSKIEETIQNQQQVIEKLKAYKQSLITEAVTGKIKIQNGKACGKYEEYKDSGVEYLGSIPKNWNVKRLRYIGKCQNGISKGGEFFGSGYPFVSYGDVYNKLVLPEKVTGLIESTAEEQENYSVKAGDIFFTRTSETIEEVGFTSVCLKTIENATFAGFVIRVRPFTDDLIPDFSKYYFSSNAHRRFFVKEMNLVTRASLSQDLLKSLPVLLPSKEEQKSIADYLNKKYTAIDTAIEQKQKLIEKLTEYKKSLIYECVTGKKVV